MPPPQRPAARQSHGSALCRLHSRRASSTRPSQALEHWVDASRHKSRHSTSLASLLLHLTCPIDDAHTHNGAQSSGQVPLPAVKPRASPALAVRLARPIPDCESSSARSLTRSGRRASSSTLRRWSREAARAVPRSRRISAGRASRPPPRSPASAVTSSRRSRSTPKSRSATAGQRARL